MDTFLTIVSLLGCAVIVRLLWLTYKQNTETTDVFRRGGQ